MLQQLNPVWFDEAMVPWQWKLTHQLRLAVGCNVRLFVEVHGNLSWGGMAVPQ